VQYPIITTVKISPEQEAKLKALSERFGMTKGAVIRFAIDRLYEQAVAKKDPSA
jgi:predicted DNA-binding protein